MIKSLLSKLGKNSLLISGSFFAYGAPLIMLYETLSISGSGFWQYASFSVCTTAVVAFMIAYKKLKEKALAIEKPLPKRFTKVGLTAIWWSIVLGVLFGLSTILDRLLAFWWQVGVCLLLGNLFFIWHDVNQTKAEKETTNG